MCRAAGAVADGFHVHPMHSVGYLRDVVRSAIDAGARANGRDGAKLELYAPVFTVTGETEAERSASEQEGPATDRLLRLDPELPRAP